MSRQFLTFRQFGFDLDGAKEAQVVNLLRGFAPIQLFAHPLCGYAVGARGDVPDGWEELEVGNPHRDLAQSYGAIAVTDLTFGRELAAYDAARKAGHYGRLALSEASQVL